MGTDLSRARIKNILHLLDQDARLTYAELGKKTRQSQETVRYTINRLLEEGIIKGHITVINVQALGYTPLQLLLKFQYLSEEKKEQIITGLTNLHYINWIGNLEGNYDLGLIISMKDYTDIHQITKEIRRLCGDHLMKKTFSINLEGQYLTRDYLVSKKRSELRIPDYSPSPPIQIDAIDSTILAALARDARTPVVDIATRTQLTPTAIIQRIKRLKQNHIITKNLLLLNQEKLGQEHYKILIFTNNQDQIQGIIEKAHRNNRVIAIIKTLAEWDLEIDMEVTSRKEVTTFIMDLGTQFSTIIRDYDILRIRDMPKYNFYPEKQTLNTTLSDKGKRDKKRVSDGII